jgi:hypothetical protein
MPITLRNFGLLLALGASLLTSACGTSARQIALTDVAARPDRAVIVFSLHVAEGQDAGEPAGPPAPARYGVDLDRYDLTRQSVVGGCFSRRDVVQAEIPNRAGTSAYFAFEVPAGAYVISPFVSHSSHWEQAWVIPASSVTYIGAFDRRVMPPRPAAINFTTDYSNRLDDARRETGLPLATAELIDVARPRPYICTP